MSRMAANVMKWGAIAVALVLVFWVDTQLASQGHLLAVVLVSMVGLAVLAIYGTRRAVPLKYLFPGLVLLVGLQIWPQVYTAMTAFTNYGDGHSISKQEAIDSIVANSVTEGPGTPRYQLSVAVKSGSDPATGDAFYLLTDPQGKTFVGDAKGLSDLTEGVEKAPTGKITAASGYTILNAIQVNARQDLKTFAVPSADGSAIKRVGLSEAFEGKATFSYAKAARFVPADGQGDALPQGWKENVGFKNFKTAVTDPVIRAGFVKILIWNMAFAAVSVVSTFVLGMLLALLLNDPRLRGKGVYRSLMILPYAIPGFVTALVWRSLFNQDYGLIHQLTHLDVDWLGDPWAARAAILLANLWLGFPYMFIVCTGALQSIPDDVKEAARIDGANPLRMLRSITMPLLLVAVGPLLIASFAFNFNNFTLIFLLTEGGPFEAANTSIGSTDLLITYAFRLAFSGVSPNYGFAAAVSVLIFIIVALISAQGFRRTKALEEIN